MKDIRTNSAFQTASGKARHILSPERILETRPEAKEKLAELVEDLREHYPDIATIVDKFKNLEVAKNKANRDYNGDQARVTDHVRAKLITKLKNTLVSLSSKGFQKILDRHGIEIAEVNNYFTDPKEETGYRAINYKLAIPVGSNENGKKEYHIVELQVVSEQIEAAYKETHEYKRRAEQAQNTIHEFMVMYDIYTVKNKELAEEYLTPEEETRLEWFEDFIQHYKDIRDMNYEACRLLNAQAAHSNDPNHNLQDMIDFEKHGKHWLTPQIKKKYMHSKELADRMAQHTHSL